jgi:PleD family two-component response regulator
MKTRLTISVEEHLARKVNVLAEQSGLSSSSIINACVRYALPKLEEGPLLNPSAPTRGRKAVSVLLVEDSATDADLLIGALRKADYEPRVERAKTAKEMQTALRAGGWDFILSDWILPEFSGLEALQIYQKSGVRTPFIIVSGRIGEEAMVEAMRAGADDYVLKDRLETLAPVMERVLARRAKNSSPPLGTLLSASQRSSPLKLIPAKQSPLTSVSDKTSTNLF